MYTQRPILCPSRRHFIIFFVVHSLLSLSYRHSLHSTFTGIKSKLKVHNIWLKHCDTIQWDHHSFMFYHHLILLSLIQALTTLNLYRNQIGAQGAQYLGEALRHNTVRSSLLHVFTIISFLSLSYRHSLHSTLTTIKSELKVHNTWLKHCDTIQWDHHPFMFLPSSHSCLFHTDTHYTQPWRQ